LLGAGARAFGYPGALAALLLVGLSSMSYMTLSTTLLMTTADPRFHGRVMSVYMLTFSMFPLMAGPLGLLADQITATTTFQLLGGVIVVFIGVLVVLNRDFLQMPSPAAHSAISEAGPGRDAAAEPAG